MESKLMNSMVELIDDQDKVVAATSFRSMEDAELFATRRLGSETKNGFVALARIFKEVEGKFVFDSEFEF